MRLPPLPDGLAQMYHRLGEGFTLGPQPNQQIISITGGPNPAIYLRDQKVTLAQLGPALDVTKREGRSIVIKADRLVSYDLVMAVTNTALERGISSVALATTPQH